MINTLNDAEPDIKLRLSKNCKLSELMWTTGRVRVRVGWWGGGSCVLWLSFCIKLFFSS